MSYTRFCSQISNTFRCYLLRNNIFKPYTRPSTRDEPQLNVQTDVIKYLLLFFSSSFSSGMCANRNKIYIERAAKCNITSVRRNVSHLTTTAMVIKISYTTVCVHCIKTCKPFRRDLDRRVKLRVA